MQHDKKETIVIRADMANNDAAAQATVYFDGACPLCTAEIKHYKSQNGSNQLSFVDVSKADAALGPDLDADTAMRRFHVRQSDGTLLSGAPAFTAIWQILPNWHWVARIAQLPGVTPVLEVGYRLFLPVRPALSKLAARWGAKPAHQRR